MKSKRVRQILQLSEKQVNRLRESGVLRATQLDNGRYYYDPASVYRYLASRRVLKGDPKEKGTGPSRVDVLYIRDSRGGSQGLERQKDRLKRDTFAYCRKEGLKLPTKSCQDYYSADEGVKRAGLRNLFKFVAEGRIGTVYAISMDRFYRGERAFLEVAMGHFGTKVVFLDEIGKKYSSLDKCQRRLKTDTPQTGIVGRILIRLYAVLASDS